MSTGAWIPVCAVADIPGYGSRRLRVGGLTVALIRTDGDTVHALEDRCPHRGGPLSEGIVSADRVACPLHGRCVELATGAMVAPDEGRTRVFGVRVIGGRVEMLRDELRVDRTEGAGECPAASE